MAQSDPLGVPVRSGAIARLGIASTGCVARAFAAAAKGAPRSSPARATAHAPRSWPDRILTTNARMRLPPINVEPTARVTGRDHVVSRPRVTTAMPAPCRIRAKAVLARARRSRAPPPCPASLLRLALRALALPSGTFKTARSIPPALRVRPTAFLGAAWLATLTRSAGCLPPVVAITHAPAASRAPPTSYRILDSTARLVRDFLRGIRRPPRCR